MQERRAVIVEMENRPVTGTASRWVSHQWTLAGVREDAAIDDAATSSTEARYAFGGLAVELHHSEGEGYWLNLTSPEPCLFVMWRQEEGEPIPTPWIVTASYNEAGRMLDAGEKVERVAMPPGFQTWVQSFTDIHYKPEPRKKVKRNDPFKDGAFRREIPNPEAQ
jgi:hypothetical protein